MTANLRSLLTQSELRLTSGLEVGKFYRKTGLHMVAMCCIRVDLLVKATEIEWAASFDRLQRIGDKEGKL